MSKYIVLLSGENAFWDHGIICFCCSSCSGQYCHTCILRVQWMSLYSHQTEAWIVFSFLSQLPHYLQHELQNWIFFFFSTASRLYIFCIFFIFLLLVCLFGFGLFLGRCTTRGDWCHPIYCQLCTPSLGLTTHLFHWGVEDQQSMFSFHCCIW